MRRWMRQRRRRRRRRRCWLRRAGCGRGQNGMRNRLRNPCSESAMRKHVCMCARGRICLQCDRSTPCPLHPSSTSARETVSRPSARPHCADGGWSLHGAAKRVGWGGAGREVVSLSFPLCCGQRSAAAGDSGMRRTNSRCAAPRAAKVAKSGPCRAALSCRRTAHGSGAAPRQARAGAMCAQRGCVTAACDQSGVRAPGRR